MFYELKRGLDDGRMDFEAVFRIISLIEARAKLEVLMLLEKVIEETKDFSKEELLLVIRNTKEIFENKVKELIVEDSDYSEIIGLALGGRLRIRR